METSKEEKDKRQVKQKTVREDRDVEQCVHHLGAVPYLI
jgi:hypothetical protein